MSDWQPIDTAPKDGTLVFAMAPHWERPCILAWRDRADGPSRWDDDSGDHLQDYEPTHWMPVPTT